MQQRTAVVVEDDRPTAALVSEVLCRAGFAVTGVGDGAEALRVVEVNNPDLVVLDGSLSGMDGIEVCRRIRELSEGSRAGSKPATASR